MTLEERQTNAEKIANEGVMRMNHWHTPVDILLQDAYLAGVDACNEEIEELEKALAFTEDLVDVQKKELNKLREPWISTEDNYPEDVVPHHKCEVQSTCKYYEAPLHCLEVTDDVLCLWEGKYIVDHRRLFDKYNNTEHVWIWEKLEGCNVTQWMPIPDFTR